MTRRASFSSAEAGRGARAAASGAGSLHAGRSLLARLALVAGLLALPAGSAAQYPSPGPANEPAQPTPGMSMERPRFSADATIHVGEGGAPEVRIDYRLSRTELLFQRGPSGYGASYEVRVILYRAKGGRQVAGDSFTRQVRAATYAETRFRGEDLVDQTSFQVPAGRYKIRIYLTDLVAEKTSSTEIEYEVPESSDSPIWLSDLTLGLVPEGKPAGAPAPNPARQYGENIVSFVAYGEVVDQHPGGSDSTFSISYKVLDDTDQSIVKGDTLLARTGPRTPFRLRPDLTRLTAGDYRFLVSLKLPPDPRAGKKRPSTIEQSKPFEVEQSRLSVGPEARGSLEVLRYIADDTEQQEMSRLTTEEERRAFWDAFWKKRDPTPDTPRNEAMEEFYKRVQYANQHFGTGGPGWKSDMGRIYIKYGPPDEVERHPFNFDRPPEEIWYYYRDRWTFVFVDRDGFGRYELVQSTAPAK